MAVRSRTGSRVALAIATLVPSIVCAQSTVRGVVRDSLLGRPFAGATVQLVSAVAPWDSGFTTHSDSSGRFVINQVPPGRYLIGFQHARLDSLGMDAVTRTLDITDARTRITADLALPTARTLAATLCAGLRDGTGVMIGRVFAANDDRGVSRGGVVVSWDDVNISAAGLQKVRMQVAEPVNDDGRYVVCGVPTSTRLGVQAVAGGLTDAPWTTGRDTSGQIEVTFAFDTPMLHRDMYVSAHDANMDGRTTPTVGVARLTGRVLTDDDHPVVGARVNVNGAANGAITDSVGSFRITGLPLGTHSVEVIALGFAPVRGSADLRPDIDASLAIRASKIVPTLDAVTVRDANRDLSGFSRRRAAGLGYFVDHEQLRKWGPPSLASALAMAPMLRKDGKGRGECKPTIFLDRSRIEIRPLDEVLQGADIGAVEVYANPADVPPEFMSPGSRPGAMAGSGGCATIIIWTRFFVP